MLEQSRISSSGIQLEVNERILDSCNGLMMAIRILVEKSKVLQREIADTSRVSSLTHEYQRPWAVLLPTEVEVKILHICMILHYFREVHRLKTSTKSIIGGQRA